MSDSERISLPLQDVKIILNGVVSSDYTWPEEPAGWWLEFIVYPDGELVMDFLHPVSGNWWSDNNQLIDQPYQPDGTPLKPIILKQLGIPFMTTFTTALVKKTSIQAHLKEVK